MSAVAKAVSSVGRVVKRAVAGVGKVISSVAKGIGKVVTTVGKAVEGTVKQALKDPIGTIAQIAAVATGQVYLLPIISAGQTIAAGGSLGDALKAAAISYAAGKIGSFAGDYAGGMFENAVPNAAGNLAFQTTSAKLAQSLAQGAITGATQAGLSGRDVMEGLKSGLISGGTGFVANQYVAPYISKNLAEIADITGDTNKFITGMTSAATKGALAAELKGQDAAAGAVSAMTGYGMKYGVDYVADAAGNMYDAFGRQFNESNANTILKLDTQDNINDYVATLNAKGLEEGKDFVVDDQGRVFNSVPIWEGGYGGRPATLVGYKAGTTQFNPSVLGRDVKQYLDLPTSTSDPRYDPAVGIRASYGGPALSGDPAYGKTRENYIWTMKSNGYEYGDDYTINDAGFVVDKYGNILSNSTRTAVQQLRQNEEAAGGDPGLLYTQEERQDLSERADAAVQDYNQAATDFEKLQQDTVKTYNQRLGEWDAIGAPGSFEDFYRNYEDYQADREQWNASGSDMPLGDWIADKKEWEASGSEAPFEDWQVEKYTTPPEPEPELEPELEPEPELKPEPELEPEPEPEEPFRVEIPETDLVAPEGGELDPRTGITWSQNEDGEWIGFDEEGNIYGEGKEKVYSPVEGAEGEVDPVSGITWYPSEDGSKIGVDEDGNYYNEDGSIFWQPDYSDEFEMEEGFTPDTEGATEFDPEAFEPVVEPGQTPSDIFGQIKDVLGGSLGQGLYKELQRRLSQPQQEQIYGSGRSYPRTPTGIYQRAAQPLLGSGFDWSSLKAPGQTENLEETRDEAFQAEKPEVGAPELFDPLKDTKWAPMSRIEGLGFAGKFINQEPISMSTFDQKSKPVQVQQVEQDTPMTTGWKTADELQAEKEQEQREQQFQPEAQDMFFDPTDVNLAQPWWQQPEFQQQQNTMPVYAAQGGLIDHNPQFYSEGGASVGMRHVKGEGDGTSDSVPAMLAADEYVLPADIVSSLGNGSSDAGASVLDQFVQVIREHKRNADPEELSEDSQGPLTYLAEAYERVGA